MLDVELRLIDEARNLRTSPTGLRFGKSRLERFDNPVIGISHRIVGDDLYVWIGEGDDPFHDADKWNGAQICRSSAAEGVRILCRSAGTGVVEIARTNAGNTPVYVTALGSTLRASWRFEDVVRSRPSPKPDIEACRLFLKYGTGKTRNQLISDVWMLWPGESVRFSNAGLRFESLHPDDIIQSTILMNDARVTDEFLRLIQDVAAKALGRARLPIVELSGGLDSSCVALAVSEGREHLLSYGLIHEGPVGLQQRERRSELITLFGLQDFEYPSFRHPPLAGLGVDESSFTPRDDNHRISCAFALDALPGDRPDLILTGIGGDELTAENSYGRHDWELAGSVPSSSIVAAASRADMFLRRGIWPKSPLAEQRMVDFCRAIPKKMRESRMLPQLALARAGASDGFLFPRYQENYGSVMQHEAATFDYDAFLKESIVEDHRIADVSGLLQEARDATREGFSHKLIFRLWLLLKLEVVLRRYLS